MNNENVNVEVNNKKKGSSVLLIILVLIVLGLVGYIIYDKTTQTTTSTKNDTEISDVSRSDTTEKENTIDEEEVLSDVAKVYEKMFDEMPNVSFSQTEDYYKNQYGNYFTDKGINELSNMFNDTTGSSILSSIFNSTDQGKRTLKIEYASEDFVVATGTYTGQGDSTTYPQYIIFKKVDNNWKIDMFE